MIEQRTIALLVVAIAILMAVPAFAHHSATMFESEKTITVEGGTATAVAHSRPRPNTARPSRKREKLTA